jgi:superfamily II DNA or RNA helicase
MEVTYNNLINLLKKIKNFDSSMINNFQKMKIKPDDITRKIFLKSSIESENINNDEIIELLTDDYSYFESIIQLHYSRTLDYVKRNKDFEYVQRKINKPIIQKENYLSRFIKFNNNISRQLNEKKSKFIKFNNIIFEWLNENNFFLEIYNSYKPEVPEPPKPTIIWRENQLAAINRLNNNGLETGIHCQATGSGKTNIILYYINYVLEKFTNPIIILFTERISILKDLFGDNKEKNIKEWKNKGICNLLNINIIESFIQNQKRQKWKEELINTKEPTLLIINRAYLTTNNGYREIPRNKINIIIHDECHNTGSEQCYNVLTYFKDVDIPIVGFSATPIRSIKKDEDKILDIYGNNKNKLNLLTDYNMINAIDKNLILPPEFFWFEIDEYNKDEIDEYNDNEDDNTDTTTKNKDNKYKVSNLEINSVLDILDKMVNEMPYKKIIAWCGDIKLCENWKIKFEENYKKKENLSDFKFLIDHSCLNEQTKKDYENFRSSDGKTILFCADKHREGSDIPKLDGCIFLDKVKNRSSNVFIQSIGRVLRKCDNPSKVKGFIFDGIAKNNDYDKIISEKIIGYYLNLQNISNIVDSNEANDNITKYKKIINNVKFNGSKLELDIGTIKIKINCHILEWKHIIKEFNSIIQKKVNLSKEEILKIDFENLKKEVKEQNIKNKQDYADKQKEFEWPENPESKYETLWNDFYDFLGIDKSKFPKDKKEWLTKCKKHKINDCEKYNKKCYEYNLPDMPEEIYSNFSNLNDELKKDKFKRR